MEDTRSSTGLRQRIGRFFYAEEVPYGLALVRIFLPLVVMGAAIPRWFHARELYSLDGAPTPLWDNFGYPGLLPIPGAAVAVALMTLYIVSLATLSCGWMSRTSALIAGLLGAYLGLLDTISTLTKYTCLATHVLLLLSLSECGSLWSVDAWIGRTRRRWPGEIDSGRRRFAVWPRRLLQCLLAVVYFAAAITKMQIPSFFSGDHMYFWMLTDLNHSNPVGEYATSWPPMLVAMGIFTIVWEIVFPFLCWRGVSKAGVLLIGVVFHILTTLMLGLYVFPAICLSLYFAFLDADEFRGFARWMRRQRRRWPGVAAIAATVTPRGRVRPLWLTSSLSASGFALICATLVGTALEVERRSDVYGLRRAAGRHTLSSVDTEQAARMLSGLERLRYEDQLHSFDVGTHKIGDRLANRRSEFEYGEQAVVECCIAPPHGDLWVECNLHDARDRLLQRSSQIMVREKIRTHFSHDWKESYPAGDYDLVLMLDGHEVARRRIRLGSPPQSASRSTATAMAR